MAPRTTERLMNLLIALLVTPTYLPKSRIREVIEPYRGQSDTAFDRMFERDKDSLRTIGITIEVGETESYHGVEPGYRIRREEFELPPIDLEPSEAAVLGVAARVWQSARLGEATAVALRKLLAAGVPVDPEALSGVEPRLAASEPAFEPIWEAVVSRTPVTFLYERADGAQAQRVVEPWRLVSWHGRWYLVGYDRERADQRLFRLSRVVGDVRAAGSPREFDVPDDADVREIAASLFPAPPTADAVVRVRKGRGLGLRRRATAQEPTEDGWDQIELPYGSVGELATEIASYGADAVAVSPPELRAEVRTRLARVLEVAHL
ncbi:WYL domain-containing protein [Mumia sp. zg.B53]|uniref:helix-turn-helix transcriptional regulator n=1 Tax=Mumia sp. zg.B21 TaxID=2855447 RepID=UPI001C6E850B|nr:WYL domain-containing protein [Mumia sp. zg.B21]MBW9205081.1 WYL domain-containing protein [Mumia sp. zg.B17]MBW9208915.1 WYL domain-containing protein [Mumia sp. zg.B21]MBW9213527.1 WYL domain-containing protein [Mumia sp. zg.B53]